jgi:hypothetical protein
VTFSMKGHVKCYWKVGFELSVCSGLLVEYHCMDMGAIMRGKKCFLVLCAHC